MENNTIRGRFSPGSRKALAVNRISRFSQLFGLIWICLVVTGCGPTISLFSEQAYQQAVNLKTEALHLIDKASEPFENHSGDVESLLLEVEKAYEYARGRPDNELSTRQWEILKDPERNLLGGFMQRWQEHGALSPAFIIEARPLIAEAFDTIIGLESGKIKPSEVQ